MRELITFGSSHKCIHAKYKQDHVTLSRMMDEGHEFVVMNYIGEQLAAISQDMITNVKQLDMFLRYLKSIEGKPLYAEDKMRVKAEFENVGTKLKYMGINTFNGALQDLYRNLYTAKFHNKDSSGKPLMDCRRKLPDGSENPNRNKYYWILA